MGALLSSQGGIAVTEFLLEDDPTAETGAVDCTYTPTYLVGKVVAEEWRRNDTTLIKSIDYTYAVNKVATEVRKVFRPDGVTIAAQVTWTYTYVANKLNSATMTRDI